jgi:hypothetical protein
MAKRIIRELLGGIGAAIGGGLGVLAFQWMGSYGYYALVLPGALLGLGAGIGAGRVSLTRGLVCAVASLPLGLFVEWRYRPFVVDDSLNYFLTHLHLLRPPTWIMLAAGTLLAFWMGRDPITTIGVGRPNRGGPTPAN